MTRLQPTLSLHHVAYIAHHGKTKVSNGRRVMEQAKCEGNWKCVRNT